jgi:DNA-binding transcriptional ArsR family regulator
MAIAKVDQLEPNYTQLADVAKALSHPARIKILHVLTDKSRCICGKIVEVLPLSQSTVSQHLKELKRVGLIDGEVEGPKTCYCINYEKLTAVQEMFTNLFSRINKCC